MEKRITDLAIAGLLHDIGKLVQRAREEPWTIPDGYEREGQPVHALWTSYFIEHNVAKNYRAAALQGVYHHQPEKSPAADRSISTLVAVADKLSAGERADDQPETSGSDYPQQMVSIFDRIGPFRTDSKNAHHYLPLGSLSLSRQALFPQAAMTKKDRLAAYAALRQNMEAIAGEGILDPETYVENLAAGLERNTWCVPSAFYHTLPDVSLYDHSRMTAALAVCLAEKEPAEIEKLLTALRDDFAGKATSDQITSLNMPSVLLIGGDISGIQKFIYTLSSKHAAKTLRGRSLYLQLLNEAVLRFVLQDLGIPRVNVIYSGGGHFYLLAPLSAANKLAEIQGRVTRILLKHHGTSLYLALAATRVPAGGFKLGKFPAYWDEMHKALQYVKEHRYSELGGELYSAVFQPQSHGGNREQTCAVCGEEKETTRSLEAAGDETTEPGGSICPLCDSFSDPLGKYLTQTNFIQIDLGEPVEKPVGTALDALAEFGLAIRLLDKNGKPLGNTESGIKSERAVLWAMADTESWSVFGSLSTAKTQHYMVNQVPEATFDELQKKAEGIPRLGVLRMDVDNLGSIFKDGFGKGKDSIATVARLSTLSFQMSLFFEGWVKYICKEVSPWIYAVYSGGDDLFLIAPWDCVTGLAARISGDFHAYTSENPDLHISGGMAFIHGKYPVYQAADDAADALDQAKSLPGKNAFHFLGTAWNWTEFAELTKKFDLLVKTHEHKAPASLLQLLQKLAQMDAEHTKQGDVRSVWGKWLWLGEYQFTRMIEKHRGNNELVSDLNTIHNDLKPYYEKIHMWGKAARWAQIYLRKSTENKGDAE